MIPLIPTKIEYKNASKTGPTPVFISQLSHQQIINRINELEARNSRLEEELEDIKKFFALKE